MISSARSHWPASPKETAHMRLLMLFLRAYSEICAESIKGSRIVQSLAVVSYIREQNWMLRAEESQDFRITSFAQDRNKR